METETTLFEPDVEIKTEQFADAAAEREVVVEAEFEAEDDVLPSILLLLSAATVEVITAQTEVVAAAVVVSGEPDGDHIREINADVVREQYADLHDLITSTQRYTEVTAAHAAADCETELVLALYYSEDTLQHVELCVRAVELPPDSADAAIDDLLDDQEVVSASYQGEYVLTDNEIRLTAGGEEWIITLPEEATTNDDWQVMRLQGLIARLLGEGEGASEQSLSAMEQAGFGDESVFTFTDTTYSVVDGRVVFEVVKTTYSLDEMIALVESGEQVHVNSMLGEALTLDDLYDRKRELEIEVIDEELVEENEDTDSVDDLLPDDKPDTAELPTIPTTEVHEITKTYETTQRAIGFFRHNSIDEPPMPSPFTLAIASDRDTELDQIVAARPVLERPILVQKMDESRQTGRVQQVDRAQQVDRVQRVEPIAVPVTVGAVVERVVAVARPTVSVQIETVSAPAVEQRKVGTKTEKVKRSEVVLNTVDQRVQLKDSAKEAETEIKTEGEMIAPERKSRERVKRHESVVRRVAAKASKKVVRRHKVVRRGKQLSASSGSIDTLMSAGGVTLVGPGGAPAFVVTQAFARAQHNYAGAQAVGPSIYYLQGDAQSGWQVVHEDTVITVTEAIQRRLPN